MSDREARKAKEYRISMTKAEIAYVFAVLSAAIDGMLKDRKRDPGRYMARKRAADAQLAVLGLAETRLIDKLASLGSFDSRAMAEGEMAEMDEGVAYALSCMVDDDDDGPGGNEA